MALLNEMSDILQSCLTFEEAVEAINFLVPQFFPTDAGALYLAKDAKNLLTPVTIWGQPPPTEEEFPPGNCWAIRSGRSYRLADPAAEILCKHISPADSPATGYLCVPLMAQGASLGILHLRFLRIALQEREPEETEAKQRLALAIAENLALALANVKLRQTLKKQAIRDPLTGLYNRSYLEETLNRVLHQARRQENPLGAVMMDLDHFKEFNETFGRAAGDALLSALADLIKTSLRDEDLACRYGGEEFFLILPGASLAATRERADNLRQAAKTCLKNRQNQVVESTTLSLGVATFPDHGFTGTEIIAAATGALSRAKQSGRDRVEIAESPPPAAAAS